MSGVVSAVSFGMPFGPLSTIPQATLLTWLNDALNAKHNLMVGQQPSVVLYSAGEGSRSVTFSRTTLPNLNAYIGELMQATGQGPARRRGIVVR